MLFWEVIVGAVLCLQVSLGASGAPVQWSWQKPGVGSDSVWVAHDGYFEELQKISTFSWASFWLFLPFDAPALETDNSGVDE